ncbi:MAG: DUF3293 domain-containing protein [Gammaproteobacteria bacterium]|nr:DUF3293 domain-containing protein [Gammaproteobacteria bacterium]MBU2408832.1 DUF3293 domain-containing protein [Gammaproteobacteria bacterium]
MPPQTPATYLDARCCIEAPGRPVLALRIGLPSPELSALYREHCAASMALLTACSPLGAVVANEQNERAMELLRADVQALGPVALPGTGRDGNPASQWPSEASIVVFGIDSDWAAELGRRHQQNAIVWAGATALPELVMLR